MQANAVIAADYWLDAQVKPSYYPIVETEMGHSFHKHKDLYNASKRYFLIEYPGGSVSGKTKEFERSGLQTLYRSSLLNE
jgi:hypothetical protein